jgi:hypothetical protein
MWVLFRVSKQLYNKIRDTINGKVDLLTTLQYEWQYEDLFKDNEDFRIVNFRYGDHIDRVIDLSLINLNMNKPNADKAKQALRYYRHGNNSYWDWIVDLVKPQK